MKDYIAFTDNLGSILSVMDENGTKVFDTSYDAWGGEAVGDTQYDGLAPWLHGSSELLVAVG